MSKNLSQETLMELTEIKTLLEQQAEVWGEFTKKNDELLAAKAEGKAVADLQATVETLNAALTKLDTELLSVQKKAVRSTAGEQLSEAQQDHKAAFKKYLRKGNDNGLLELQQKAMNTGSDPDGGYLVLPEMDKTIDRVAGVMSAMYSLANVVTIGTARYEKLVKTSGMAMRRVADGATGGETTEPKYAKIAIEVFTAEVEPWVYNETLEDAFIDLEADLATEAGIGFAEGAAAEYITGNGVGKAQGITAYTNVINTSWAWGKIGYIPSGLSAGFAASNPSDKLISLQHALKAQYRPGAVWLVNDATLGIMRQMKDGSGSFYLWNPDPAGGFGGRFLGSPVYVDDNMPDIAAGSFSVAYGNFQRGYTIVNRTGVSLIRDNITSKGVTKMNFRKRFGAGIVSYEAIKLLKFSTS